MFPRWPRQPAFPPAAWGAPLSPRPPHHVLLPDGARWCPTVALMCISPMPVPSEVEHLFLCPFATWVFSLEKRTLCSVLPPILWSGLGFCCEWCESVTDFGYELLIRYTICKYFLPFGRLSLHFVVQKWGVF